MSKKSIIWLIIIIIIAAVLIWYGVSRKPAEEEVIKIGAILPLSGTRSMYGQAVKEGVELAVSKINQKGIEEKQLQIIYEDDQGSAANGVNSARKLIDIDKVKIIITSLSPTTLAVAPIAEENQIVLISTISQASALTEAGDYIFRVVPLYSLQGKALANFVYDNNYHKAGVIFNNSNDAMVDGKDAFVQEFTNRGGAITGTEGYEGKSSDMRTELLKLRNTNPDVLVMFSLVKDAGLVLKQSGELGINLPILSASGIEDPQVIEVAGQSAEGVIFCTANIVPPEDFVDEYQEKFGHQPLRYSSESYDGIMILSKAIEQCREITSTCIKNNLYKTKDYQGVSGSITFDENGDVIKPILFKTIKNGQFVPYNQETGN